MIGNSSSSSEQKQYAEEFRQMRRSPSSDDNKQYLRQTHSDNTSDNDSSYLAGSIDR